MQINSDIVSELAPKSIIETPVKKTKAEQPSALKTAQSPTQSPFSIRDIDAESLINNFSKYVTISTSSPIEEDKKPVYRRLDFDDNEIKLNFDESTASMKKKGDKKIKSEQCHQIKPFSLSQMLNSVDDSERLQSNEFIPLKVLPLGKQSKEMLVTPAKKQGKNLFVQNTPKKENPFRDL